MFDIQIPVSIGILMKVPASVQPATPRQIAMCVHLSTETAPFGRSTINGTKAQTRLTPTADTDAPPGTGRVAFAEKPFSIKRRAVPDVCSRDKNLLSQWIDGNKCLLCERAKALLVWKLRSDLARWQT